VNEVARERLKIRSLTNHSLSHSPGPPGGQSLPTFWTVLSNHFPNYRILAGDYRALFEVARIRSLSIVSSTGENPTVESAMSIHPQIIEKDGRKEFVVLPYEEFLQMQEEIENYEDHRTLREEKATAHAEPTRSLDAFDIISHSLL
jgi:PHD/YefM family antitoxin component YafN of YafNO toxin-antitoxin module